MNILFTCAGRRTYLLKYFKEQLGDGGKIIGADMQLTAPALSAADERVLVPAVYDEHYVDALLEICELHKVDVLISLNDLELPILADKKSLFSEIGTTVLVSSPDVIDICFDKLKTSQYIESLGLRTPKTFSDLDAAMNALHTGELQFPLVIKPRWGSASIGIEYVDSIEDLQVIYELIKRKIRRGILGEVSQHDENFILIQQKITGKEYGLDIINDLSGNNVSVSVKQKLAMRAGETDKATTVDSEELRRIGQVIGSNLGHIGNLDCDILEMDGKFYILELNPRFGGGFPFSYQAGVNLPKAIIKWIKGEPFDNNELCPVYGLTYAKCDYLVDMTRKVVHQTQQQSIAVNGVKKIAVYGAGGLGREVAGGIQRINNGGRQQWEIIGFFDDNIPVGTQVSHFGHVLGGIEELNAFGEPLALAIAVGSPKTRKQIHDRITNSNISFPNLIAPSFRVLDRQTFEIGEGNIIQDNCSVTCDVKIGNFNVLNGSNALGHDVCVGDFNVLMPGVRLSGEVTVGNCNLLGVDSIVLQRVKMGDCVTLGAGSVMMTKPKDGFTYIGIPAKKFDYE
ncbi:MAG: ATP-grasp domain-containing protein [Muribaculaceae bacterium]|nr:ATP-grasp domain-containing protein [Muribaculaceae bacterium]